MRKKLYYLTSFLVAVTGASVAPVSAQQLEEIVVTARKREESLMEVPMSITAVSATNLEAAGIKEVRDIAQYTPGMWVQYALGGPSTSRALTFRGLSVSNGGQLFIDGAPYVGQADPDLGALERVEVLLGPQSAYFGRSTFTGALNYVTKNPSMDGFKGKVGVEIGSYGRNDESISLEGPIVADKLAVRLTARHYSMDGQWRNNSDPAAPVGDVKKNSVMAIAVFTPNDSLKFKAMLNWTADEGGMPPAIGFKGFNYNGAQGGQFASRQLSCNLGGTFGPYWCGALPQADNLQSLQLPGTADILSWYNSFNPTIKDILIENSRKAFPPLFDPHWNQRFGYRQLNQGVHLNTEYTTASGWQFSAVTALHYTKAQNNSQTNFRDSTGVPNTSPTRILPWIGYYFLTQSENYDASQELRVTSPQDRALRFTAGGNYLNARSPGNLNVSIQPAGLGISGTITRSVIKTPAVFGGVYYDITPELTLGAEARYQWDNIASTAKFPVPAPAAAGTLQAQFKSFSPRVTIDYKIGGGVIYGLWSRGYRPGGFNNAIVGAAPTVLAQLGSLNVGLAFLQEKMDNFEAGIKQTFFDNRLQGSLGVYYDKWRNGQVTNTLSVNTPTQVQQVSVTQNVGAVDLSGIEFTGAAAITEQFRLTGNVNYVHSKILAYVYTPNGTRINNSTNVNGKSFPNAPVGWTFTLTPQYTDHLVGDWEWFARLDWKHRGRYYADATNVAWIPANDTVDIHLGVKDQRITLEAYGLNLNKNYNFVTAEYGVDSICCLGASNINEVRLLLPAKRQFGIRGTYQF